MSEVWGDWLESDQWIPRSLRREAQPKANTNIQYTLHQCLDYWSERGEVSVVHHSPTIRTNISCGLIRKAVRYAIDASVAAAAPSKPTASSSDYPNTEPIKNLCSTIQNAGSRKPGVPPASMSMGALLGEQDIRWHCLQPRSAIAFPFETIRALPLDVVLLNGGLKPAETLTLGVQIALAMMQLHTTQWLGDDWTKKDIFILHRAVKRQVVGSGQRMVIWEPILEHPFVHRTFDGQPRQISAAESVADYNRCLFSLGVVLIELALGKPIEELGALGTIDYHGHAQDPRADPVRTTAMNCIGYVYSKEAPAYGDAVERCINGLRLPEPIPKDLNNPQYKNEVQAKIVSVLERNLGVRNDTHHPHLRR